MKDKKIKIFDNATLENFKQLPLITEKNFENFENFENLKN